MPKLSATQVGGWDPLVEGLKLENAWVFASDDAIPGAVKAFLDFEKALLEPIPKPERAKFKLTDISGVVSMLLGHSPQVVTPCSWHRAPAMCKILQWRHSVCNA